MPLPKDESATCSATCSLTDLKPGDIVTAYMKGVHEVVAVERRYLDEYYVTKFQAYKDKKAGDEYAPLIHYRRKLNSNGNKAPNQIHACDVAYCSKITQEMVEQEFDKTVKQAKKKRDATMELLEKRTESNQ